MKKRIIKLVTALLVSGLALSAFAGCSNNDPAPDKASAAETESAPADGGAAEPVATDGAFKVAVLLPGSANDGSWNQFGYEALKTIEAELGAEIAYSENVTSIDQLQAMRDYAGKGFNVIFGHGGQFEDDMKKAGDEFPDTHFVIIAGNAGNDSNVIAVDTAPWQYGYTYGWHAGKITKTNKVGFITAMEGVATMNNLAGSWRDAAKKANPDCETTIVYISDMSDVAEAREAAIALAASGCDVIMHELNAGTQGVIDVCKEQNIYTLGRTPGDVEFAPDQVLTHAIFDWGPKYLDLAKQAKEGVLGGGSYFFGYHTDVPGFIFKYDDANEWNPVAVTPDLAEPYQQEVVEMFKADPIRTYTTEDAKGGTA